MNFPQRSFGATFADPVRNQLHLWPEETAGDRISWSVTRDKRMRTCLRKYYLHHFASRGGGQPSASPALRELYVLKYLRNRWMWVGEVVHELVELALVAFRRGDNVPVDALVERGTRRMRAQYAESIQAMYRDRPHQACGLVEHEYRHDLSRDDWKALRDRMERCVRTLFGLPLLGTLRGVPEWRWLALESTGSFEHEGATVVVKPDCAWRDEDDRVVIVDWKTGQPRLDEERLQLAVYALFARRAWAPASDVIRAQLVYLESGHVDELELGPADLEWGEQAIRESLRSMRELAHGDPAPERFPLTDDASRCALCPFQRVCGR